MPPRATRKTLDDALPFDPDLDAGDTSLAFDDEQESSFEDELTTPRWEPASTSDVFGDEALP